MKGAAATFGKRPFKVTYATNQKCMDRLTFFLERNLDVFFDKEESVIEIKEYEFLPAIFLCLNSKLHFFVLENF